MRRMSNLLSTALFIAAFGLCFETSVRAEMIEIVDDQELANIQARGFYFRMDLSLEAFTDSSTTPQIVVNEGNRFVVQNETPTGGIGGPGGGGGNINLSGAAQGNLNALINIIGANSVINVGLNIINIQNSNGDSIHLTNENLGILGGHDVTAILN